MLELLFLIASFVILSGLLAMIDAAVLSVSPAEIEVMITKKRWGAVELKKLHAHIIRAIVIIVILTNITNVLGPILVGQKAVELYGNDTIGVITAVLTFCTIIFSEIIPKGIGSHYAPRIGRLVAPFLHYLIIGLYPLVLILEKLVRTFRRGKRKIGTEAQIRALTSLGEDEGHIAASEGELISKAFILHDHKTRDIMTPRHSIVAFPISSTIRYAAKMVFQHSYSRYPVFGDSIDDVRGQALSRDILEALAEGRDTETASTITHAILTVPGDMLCNHLLALFREKQIHMAIVQDNHKTVGLVTLEDVLEELVGEIEDERDFE